MFIFKGGYAANKMEGNGWWRSVDGKFRPGVWKEGKLIEWTGGERFKISRLETGKKREKAKKTLESIRKAVFRTKLSVFFCP